MEGVLKFLLARFGWKSLLKKVWSMCEDDLRAAAAKSQTKFDDGLIDIVDDVINAIVDDKAA